jgi:alcohol dehydrogenase class IV
MPAPTANTPKPFVFGAPTTAWFGPGRRHEIGSALRTVRSARPLVVTTKRALDDAAIDFDGIDGATVAGTFAEVTPHSTVDEVDTIVAMMREGGADGVVALGGGSVLGAAKCAVASFTEGRPLAELTWTYDPASGELRVPELQPAAAPILAIPTTAGSASESNKFGSVRDPATGEKVRARHPTLAPALAILDPELTVGLPRDLTAGTGVNAFAHCVEAIYSKSSDPISTALSLEAARLIVANLPIACENPGDIDARGQMQIATFMSGMALNNTLVCLHHALCHPLGNICGVAHGAANFAMLPHALRYNLPAVEEQLIELGRFTRLLDANGPQTGARFIDALVEWMAPLGGTVSLESTGQVTAADIPRLAESAFKDTCVYFNPRPVASPDELAAIYRAAL